MKIKSKKWIDRDKLQKWRQEILKRDNKECVICKSKNTKLHVHHILPRIYKDFKYDIDNGITLCYYHHKVGKHSAHNNAVWFADWLERNRKDIYYLTLKRLKEDNKIK